MEKDNLHKKSSGFKVPEGYFENFESHLLTRLPFKTETKNISTTKIGSGFKIPEEYFANLENKIYQKIKEVKPKRKMVFLITRKNIIYLSGVAAMIAIVISLSTITKSKLNFGDITITDAYTYFNDENIELDNIEIATLLENDVSYADMLEKEIINNDTILDYLSTEDLDEEIILIE